MDPLRASCAVVLADDHAGAAGKAQKAADEHIDDGAHCAYGGEGLVGDEIAHHPCIHHVVQLLKDVARQQRQRKANQMAGDIAFGHIHAGVGRMRVLDMVHSLAFLYMIFVSV